MAVALPKTGVGDGFALSGRKGTTLWPRRPRTRAAFRVPKASTPRPCPPPPTDNDLVRGALLHERPAQRALYGRYSDVVYATCLRYAPDADTARDFAQEAWLRAFAKLDRYDGDGSLEGWLRRLTARRCISLLRKRGVKTAELPAVLPKGYHVEPEALDALTAAELRAHVAALPEGYRLVFHLVAVEGFTHREAAEALGITAATSRSQLTRARAALQRRLAQLLPVCL